MTELKHLSEQLSIGPEYQKTIETLKDYVRKLVMMKLPKGKKKTSDELMNEISTACHAVIGEVWLETWLMYVNPEDLEQRNKEALEAFKKMGKWQKKRAPLYAPINYDEISRNKDNGKIRKHFQSENFINGVISGVYFRNHEGKVIACVYHHDEKMKDYILINHTLCEFPVSARVFVEEVLKAFHKIHDKYTPTRKK